jgi:hypothetical protein
MNNGLLNHGPTSLSTPAAAAIRQSAQFSDVSAIAPTREISVLPGHSPDPWRR